MAPLSRILSNPPSQAEKIVQIFIKKKTPIPKKERELLILDIRKVSLLILETKISNSDLNSEFKFNNPNSNLKTKTNFESKL